MLQKVHCDNCSVIQYNDENSLACVLSLAYYSAQDSYAVYRELQGGEGFADLVFVPRTGNHNPAMIVELKWNQTTGIALEQIKDRNYIRCLKDYHGKVLFVGVNYDKKSKKHACQFEMVEIWKDFLRWLFNLTLAYFQSKSWLKVMLTNIWLVIGKLLHNDFC